jgi:hypothetical protein
MPTLQQVMEVDASSDEVAELPLLVELSKQERDTIRRRHHRHPLCKVNINM